MDFMALLFFPIFIGMWVFVTYVIAKVGWADLVEHFRFGEDFVGKKIGVISAGVNGASYQNALVLKCNHVGIYLRPTFLFRMFHPPILIPYKSIVDVKEKKVVVTKSVELIVGQPYIATIKLNARIFEKIKGVALAELKLD